MENFYLTVCGVLLFTIGLGLLRVIRGPTSADRMLAAQLLGTTSVAILLILAQVLAQPSLRDVALVMALLAAVSGVAFVRLMAKHA
jgi:multicomponent Na+:H+ antiporter subunit F